MCNLSGVENALPKRKTKRIEIDKHNRIGKNTFMND